MEALTARENFVTLGLAGDLVSWDASVGCIIAKAGGRPFFIGSRAPCQANDIACTICKGLLSLVAQAHLPPVTHSRCGSGNTAQTVYVFCCTQESCAARSDSWRAFTHVSPRDESSEGDRQNTDQSPSVSGRQTSSVSAAEEQKHHEGSCDAKADAWDLSSDAWGVDSRQNEAHSTSGTGPQAPSLDAAQETKGSAAAKTDTWGLSSDDWGVSKAEPAGTDVMELNSALENLSMQPNCHSQERPRQSKGGQEKDKHQQHGSGVQACSIDGLPCLPEFELWLQSEPGKAEACMNTSDDIQQAISAYEQSAASGGSQSSSSKQPEGSWAHEQYEEEAAFSKYTKRLQRCPGQCLRLSTGGSVLWPRKQFPVAPWCSRCHEEKECIVQLMAPLIAMLYEAADWVKEVGEGYSHGELVHVPASWEWLTVAVFACTGQCASKPSSEMEEETVIVLNETNTEGGWAY